MSWRASSPFVARLLETAPELGSAYEGHLRNNDELLPHVFMGDVTRSVIEASKDPANLPWLSHLLRFLETELQSGDHEARDLILASFCENLMGERPATKVLLPLMGPSLRTAMREFEK